MFSNQLRLKPASPVKVAHPLKMLEDFDLTDSLPESGVSVGVLDAEGVFCGTGIFDPSDPVATWRRFSMAEGAVFDETYLAGALQDAIQRRGDESSQRLVSSDSDFIPGLIIELFNDVAVVTVETNAVRVHRDFILGALRDVLDLAEVVVCDEGTCRTMSGNNLKARWIKVDELRYRIDFLNVEKPGFPLRLREQHVLFGSLCEDRRVLDLNAYSGGFAMQAMNHGAASALAVDSDETFTKAIGANAQRNELAVEVFAGDVVEFLDGQAVNSFDAIVVQVAQSDMDCLDEICAAALRVLPGGGLFAVYREGRAKGQDALDAVIAGAAGQVGREARVFARTTQPFDYPMLLNLPESQVVEGILLEVL